MASLHKDQRNGNFSVHFRWAGIQFCKSCLTSTEKTANGVKARVEETLRLLKLGRMEIPPGADAGVWIMTEGKQTEKPQPKAAGHGRFAEICKGYLADQHHKEPTTLAGERTHIKHLLGVLGQSTRLASISARDLQDYVAKQKATFSGVTLRKQLATFSQIWDWARVQGHVETDCPIFDQRHRWAIKIEKGKDRSGQFKTLSEIEATIARGGLTDAEQKELWSLLFLDSKQVDALLAHVKKSARFPFVYPMVALAAFTGIRRSELCRAKIEDFDFEHDKIKVREKKRKKDKAESQRIIPMHPRLASIMRAWFADHPGGRFAIAPPLAMQRRTTKAEFEEMTVTVASNHFREVLKTGKWKVVRGFHVLRHSFGANALREGIPREIVAKWMGHTTEQMRDLYQHIFPDDEQAFMRRFAGGVSRR